jgi:hypothetical protein
MSKFTFIVERFDYDEYTGEEGRLISKTTREFYGHHLEGLLDEMTEFLRGAGYHLDGHLDVVSYEHKIDMLDEELDELKSEEQSRKVFSHMVREIEKNPISLKGAAAESQFVVNLDNMNTNYVFGSNDFDNVGAAHGTFTISDEIDISTLSSIEPVNINLSNDVELCSACKLPVSVMQLHQCFDPDCPCGAYRSQFHSPK